MKFCRLGLTFALASLAIAAAGAQQPTAVVDGDEFTCRASFRPVACDPLRRPGREVQARP